jgi:hypothetical protein
MVAHHEAQIVPLGYSHAIGFFFHIQTYMLVGLQKPQVNVSFKTIHGLYSYFTIPAKGRAQWCIVSGTQPLLRQPRIGEESWSWGEAKLTRIWILVLPLVP